MFLCRTETGRMANSMANQNVEKVICARAWTTKERVWPKCTESHLLSWRIRSFAFLFVFGRFLVGPAEQDAECAHSASDCLFCSFVVAQRYLDTLLEFHSRVCIVLSLSLSLAPASGQERKKTAFVGERRFESKASRFTKRPTLSRIRRSFQISAFVFRHFCSTQQRQLARSNGTCFAQRDSLPPKTDRNLLFCFFLFAFRVTLIKQTSSGDSSSHFARCPSNCRQLHYGQFVCNLLLGRLQITLQMCDYFFARVNSWSRWWQKLKLVRQ